MPRPSSPCKGHFVIIQIPCVALDVLWLCWRLPARSEPPRRPSGRALPHVTERCYGLRARETHALPLMSVFYVPLLVFSFQCDYTCYGQDANDDEEADSNGCSCNRRDALSLTAVSVACIVCCLLLLSLSLCGAPHNTHLSVSATLSLSNYI